MDAVSKYSNILNNSKGVKQ
ncbi:hypothetical protein APK20_12 [Acinetobacter phage APK20]|uniref:Uncharacterized protein n=1 Tax=Acinetobacter phage APK20 TaxID=2873375 RepID=A0AAE8XKZ3_9CAUD|nr:hypothetical protein APK20_12 [Acinetobacter phage APK20]